MADLPLTRFSIMRSNPMSDTLNALLCSASDGAWQLYSYASALVYYNGENLYRRIPQALKYRRDFRTGRYFASMLGQELAASGLYSDVSAVIPVPLHWTRELKRGYNQADFIAREVASCLGTEALCGRRNPLMRRHRTGTQTKLGSEGRAMNVRDAFTLRSSLPDCGHVLLVDDVFTTGATLSACIMAIRTASGPSLRISVATLAFVDN